MNIAQLTEPLAQKPVQLFACVQRSAVAMLHRHLGTRISKASQASLAVMTALSNLEIREAARKGGAGYYTGFCHGFV